MRLLPLLVLTLAVGACDSDGPGRYGRGIVEGTYTLPDGTTGEFRRFAGARASPTVGWGGDIFLFGTRYQPPGSGFQVNVDFQQSGLEPRPGRYSARSTGPGQPGLRTFFGFHNLTRAQANGVPDTSYVLGWYPEGTVDLRVDGSVISGSFELSDRPYGVYADTSLRIAVRGRFEIEYEPYRD